MVFAVQTIKEELDNAIPCVSVWNETAQHLLGGIQSADAAEASSRLAYISDRLQHLNRVCLSQLEQLESVVGGNITPQVRIYCVSITTK